MRPVFIALLLLAMLAALPALLVRSVTAPAAATGLVTAISAGGAHSCAVKDGGVWCWGWNGGGQLGNNSTADSPVPVAVTGLASGASAISAATTPPLTAPEEITVVPGVATVSPHTQIETPVTAVAQANAQPLTADGDNGSKRGLLYGAAAVAAILAIILLIVAVRGGGRSRQT